MYPILTRYWKEALITVSVGLNAYFILSPTAPKIVTETVYVDKVVKVEQKAVAATKKDDNSVVTVKEKITRRLPDGTVENKIKVTEKKSDVVIERKERVEQKAEVKTKIDTKVITQTLRSKYSLGVTYPVKFGFDYKEADVVVGYRLAGTGMSLLLGAKPFKNEVRLGVQFEF